jgi:hypothetical protein
MDELQANTTGKITEKLENNAAVKKAKGFLAKFENWEMLTILMVMGFIQDCFTMGGLMFEAAGLIWISTKSTKEDDKEGGYFAWVWLICLPIFVGLPPLIIFGIQLCMKSKTFGCYILCKQIITLCLGAGSYVGSAVVMKGLARYMILVNNSIRNLHGVATNITMIIIWMILISKSKIPGIEAPMPQIPSLTPGKVVEEAKKTE